MFKINAPRPRENFSLPRPGFPMNHASILPGTQPKCPSLREVLAVKMGGCWRVPLFGKACQGPMWDGASRGPQFATAGRAGTSSSTGPPIQGGTPCLVPEQMDQRVVGKPRRWSLDETRPRLMSETRWVHPPIERPPRRGGLGVSGRRADGIAGAYRANVARRVAVTAAMSGMEVHHVGRQPGPGRSTLHAATAISLQA